MLPNIDTDVYVVVWNCETNNESLMDECNMTMHGTDTTTRIIGR